jgi:hypothetical protein
MHLSASTDMRTAKATPSARPSSGATPRQKAGYLNERGRPYNPNSI